MSTRERFRLSFNSPSDPTIITPDPRWPSFGFRTTGKQRSFSEMKRFAF